MLNVPQVLTPSFHEAAIEVRLIDSKSRNRQNVTMADSLVEKECPVKVFTPERRLLAFGSLKIKRDRSGDFMFGLFTPDEKSLPPHRDLDISPQVTVYAESTNDRYELHNWQLVRHSLGEKLHFEGLVMCDGIVESDATRS